MRRAALLIPIVLWGCSGPARAPEPQPEVDPAIAAALSEPIMTDVELRAAADAAPVLQAAVPVGASVDVPADAPTLGQLAQAAARTSRFAGCDARIGYSADWMNRLPPELALPDAARLSEAAGSDVAGCGLRIMRYGIAATPAQMLDRYAAIARRHGFATTRSEQQLTATRAPAAFTVAMAATASGTVVDLTSRR